MKKILTIIGIVAVSLLALGAVKDLVIKAAVEKGVELVTGLKLHTGAFRVGVLNTMVDIRNVRLHNPAGFKDKVMIDMPRIYVAYSLPSILKGRIYLRKVRIELKEFVVVKNEKGQLNLDSLKVAQAQKKGAAKPAAKADAKAPEIHIDVLELEIGRALYKDYSKGGEPSVKEFNINLDERYTDVNDPYTVVSLIVVKSLANTSVASLTNFDLKGMQGAISGTLASAQKAAGQAVETAKQAAARTQEVARTARDAAKKTQEVVTGLTKALKSPFGP